MKKIYIKWCSSVLTLIMLFLSGGCSTSTDIKDKPGNKSYIWPTESWKVSTPEEQGMDSTYLSKMLKVIGENGSGIHSVLIVRNGYLVTEAYADPYDANTKHDLFSASKSITSALVGIALEEKKIASINQRAADIFSDYGINDLDDTKKSMTIKNLLTMSTGHTEDTTAHMVPTGDWIQAFFDMDVPEKPGTRFVYNSGASYMLSAIIQKTTGESAFNYAEKKLFKPLGIDDVWWETAPDGSNSGGWGLHMTPRDMAKFGYLYLNEGVWEDRQIVSKEWVKESTGKQIETGPGGSGYGYQWWMNSFGGYRADGYAGQYIFVIPNLDLVAVFTGGLNYSEKNPPEELVKKYIIPAVKSTGKISDNPKATGGLAEATKELISPKPKNMSIPEKAEQYSGKTFIMDTNNYGIESIELNFDNRNEYRLALNQNGVKYDLLVGMDGVYRKNKAQRLGTFVWYPSYEEIGLRGNWDSPDRFVLEWQYVGEPYKEKYTMTFDKDSIKIDIAETVQDISGMVPQRGTLYGKCK